MPKASIIKKKRITAELRREIVLNLKLQGMSDRAIRDDVKLRHNLTMSHSQVNVDWHTALSERKRLNDDEVDEFFGVLNARYERIITVFWHRMLLGDRQAADVIARQLGSIRKLNGLDREIGSAENPFHLTFDDVEYDYGQLSNEELEQLANLNDKATVTDIADARRRFAS